MITVSIQDYLSAMIAARLLGPGDVIIVVSSTGRTSSTLSIADAASSAGASLIAITNQYDTPLATLANVSLVVGGVDWPSSSLLRRWSLLSLCGIKNKVAGLNGRVLICPICPDAVQHGSNDSYCCGSSCSMEYSLKIQEGRHSCVRLGVQLCLSIAVGPVQPHSDS